MNEIDSETEILHIEVTTKSFSSNGIDFVKSNTHSGILLQYFREGKPRCNHHSLVITSVILLSFVANPSIHRPKKW